MSVLLAYDHVQLAIPRGGEDRARAFFVDLIGMREVPKPVTLSPHGCWFEAGAVSLHIGVDPDFRPATKAHPAFLVADLEDLRTRLEAAGVACREDKPLAGYLRFFAEDPFGNRLEFMQKV
ncbi:VOC family protein [Alteriqipengyuania sp. 357]